VTPASGVEPVWGVVDGLAFDSRQWGDDVMLYVMSTGETHALAPAESGTFALLLEHSGSVLPAARWLNLMSDGPVSGGAVTNASSADGDLADLSALQEALENLHRIGVVARRTA
jgi:hypothetical protein